MSTDSNTIKDTKEQLSSSTTLLQCSLCAKTATNYENLVAHYAFLHYKEQILKHINPEDKNQCGICDTKFPLQHSLMYHIAHTHKILRDVIPDLKDVEALKELRTAKDLETKPALEIRPVPRHILSIEGKIVKPNKTDRFECFKCQIKFAGFNKLLTHIAIEHLKEKLLNMFQKAPSQCNLCDQLCKNATILLIHLVQEHNALEGMIPPTKELNVKTSPKETNLEVVVFKYLSNLHKVLSIKYKFKYLSLLTLVFCTKNPFSVPSHHCLEQLSYSYKGQMLIEWDLILLLILVHYSDPVRNPSVQPSHWVI